jgi:RNA polymerase sigma factor (sigma-70 family)
MLLTGEHLIKLIPMPFDAVHFSEPRQALAMMQVDDWQLARLKRADVAAQTDTFRRFEKPLYTFCMRLLGQSADALDATQESFIQGFTQIHQFRGESPFGAWLRAIALRICAKRIKSRDNWISESQTAGTFDDQKSTDLHTDARIDLELALSQLSDQSRAVVWMYCVENYSHQEIADSFGLSLSFSKSCVARSLKSLRDFLNPSVQNS